MCLLNSNQHKTLVGNHQTAIRFPKDALRCYENEKILW